MSVHVMSWVFKHSEAVGNDRMCLLVLANYADDEGLSWPSVARIAREMRVGARTAQRSLHKLAEDGHIRVEPNGAPDSRQRADRKTNAYHVLNRGDTRGANSDTPSDGVSPSHGVTADAPRGDNPGLDGVTPAVTQTIIDPSVDPSTESGAKAPSSVTANGRRFGSAEKGSAKAAKPKPSPDEFVITPEMRAWAAENVRGVDVDGQTDQFLDWWRAVGPVRPFKNAVAAWQNWLRKAKPGGMAPWKQRDLTNRNPANVYGDEHRVGGSRRIQ